MKIRKGFVSNSSSSSFVTLGFEIPEEKYEELCDEYKILCGYEDGVEGYVLTDLYDSIDDEDSAEYFDVDDLLKSIENLKKTQKKINVNSKIKLYFGSRLS